VDLNPDDAPSDEVDYQTCEVCGQYPIRFVHTIEHPEYPGPLDVGCVCVEKLTGDYVSPKRHEARLRQRSRTRANWLKKPWNISANGNPWIKLHGYHAAVFPSRRDPSKFGAIVNRVFSVRTFDSARAAKLACLDQIHRLHSKKHER
jgi:hypothetical protein